MTLGWSLGGYWKVGRDQATRNLEKLRGLEGNGVIAPLAGAGSKSNDKFSTVVVSFTPSRTATQVEVTPLPTSMRRKGGSEGHGQGLPLNCIDRGDGVVTCA